MPVWVWLIPAGHTHPLRELFTELHANSVSIPGEAVERICAEAANNGVVGCCRAFHKNDIPDRLEFKGTYLGELDGWINLCPATADCLSKQHCHRNNLLYLNTIN